MADLYQGQSADGLWRGSPIKTIHHLFGLHLTVRHPDPPIAKGLDALLNIAMASEMERDAVVVRQGRRQQFEIGSTEISEGMTRLEGIETME